MTLKLADSGGILRTATSLQMRDAGGVMRAIKTLKMRDAGGTLRTVLTAAPTISTTLVKGTGRSNSYITIATTNVGVSGGVSWSWAQTSGDGEWSIINPTSSATGFIHTNTSPIAPDNTQTATFVCTITYADSTTAASPTVTATVRNISTL